MNRVVGKRVGKKCCVVHVDNMVINIVITNLNADLSDLLVELIELVRQ